MQAGRKLLSHSYSGIQCTLLYMYVQHIPVTSNNIDTLVFVYALIHMCAYALMLNLLLKTSNFGKLPGGWNVGC